MTPKKQTTGDGQTPKKATPKKAASAKKATAKKAAPAKKATAKKAAPAKKATAKKAAPAKKTSAKKSAPAKKTSAKKTTPHQGDVKAEAASLAKESVEEVAVPVAPAQPGAAGAQPESGVAGDTDVAAQQGAETAMESDVDQPYEQVPPQPVSESQNAPSGPDVTSGGDVSRDVPDESPREIDRVVVFFLDGRRFALPLDAVQEIQQIVELTSVPDDVQAYVGMIDLRGTVVPVVDLRLLLGMEEASYSIRTPMVFCTVRGQLVALIVDEVDDVVELAAGALQPTASMSALGDRLIGVCRIADDMVFVFDPDQLVPAADLKLLERRARGGV